MKPKQRYNLESNQRASAWPSYMEEGEDGVWRDTRTELPAATPTVDTPDMQVESEMVSNDGGEREDRDGEDRPGARQAEELQRAWLENAVERVASMAGEITRDRFTTSSDTEEEDQSTDESDNYEAPF